MLASPSNAAESPFHFAERMGADFLALGVTVQIGSISEIGTLLIAQSPWDPYSSDGRSRFERMASTSFPSFHCWLRSAAPPDDRFRSVRFALIELRARTKIEPPTQDVLHSMFEALRSLSPGGACVGSGSIPLGLSTSAYEVHETLSERRAAWADWPISSPLDDFFFQLAARLERDSLDRSSKPSSSALGSDGFRL